MKRFKFQAKYRSMSTLAVAEETYNRNIPVIPINKTNFLQLGIGKNSVKIKAGISSNLVAGMIADNKDLTKFFFKNEGLPTAEWKITKNLEETVKFSKEIGYPVVIKPKSQAHGIGVYANIKNEDELREFYPKTKAKSEAVIVEKFIEGEDYRITVIGEKIIGVTWRIPARVTGDGKSTIEELIKKANKDPRRGEGNEKPMSFIEIDNEVHRVLKRKGLTLKSIPKEGEIVRVRQNANISMGGEGVDITDKIHPKIKEQSLRITRTIGLPITGIDVLTTDISKPLKETNGAFIEISSSPAIYIPMFPSKGKPRDSAKAIVDLLFPPDKNPWIPIFLHKKLVKNQETIERNLDKVPNEVILEENGKENKIEKPTLTLFSYLIDPAVRKIELD